ncbi:MAG: hypothetical protein V4712_15280 [Pseudomonadota bacterium]
MADIDPDTGLPIYAFDRPETGDLALAPAQFEKDAIENNYWRLRQRRTGEAEQQSLEALSETIYGDRRAFMTSPVDVPEYNITAKRDAQIAAMFATSDRLRANMPGEFANLPSSFDDLKAQAEATARRELQEELEDTDGVIANRSDPNVLGGAASFMGSMAAGVSDIEGVATLPFGAGAGSLARTVLIESLLGGAGAAMQIPAQQDQAAFLGTKAPDPVDQVLMGFAFGAALPIAGRGVVLGANSLTPSGRVANRELLSFGRRKDATPAERGATQVLGREEATRDTAPKGIAPDDHAARVNQAEVALEDSKIEMIRARDVIPDVGRKDAAAAESPYAVSRSARPASDVTVDYDLAGKTRDKPVSDSFLADLQSAVAPLGDDIGVKIVSGGQDAIGTPGGKRKGSERHDVDHTGHAHTADVVLTRNGVDVLPGDDPELYARFLYRAAGVYPGVGHYDWGVHVGGGSQAAWGPDTTSATLDPLFGEAIGAGRGDGAPRLPKDYPNTERRILDMIGGAEAPRGYDQVYSGIPAAQRPPKPLSTMTVDEVLAWQDSIDGSNASEAAGRYQYIEDTLRGLRDQGVVTGDALFDRATQDKLALHSMRQVGLDDYLNGTLSPEAFGDRLAQIWAGLPMLTGDKAGRSYYAGDGINGSTVGAQEFLDVLARGKRWQRTSLGTEGADVQSFDPRNLQVDATAYQYKMGGDPYGVTNRLASATSWDTLSATGIIVHERLNGQMYVADGHQRTGLARRLMAEGHEPILLQGNVLKEEDGWTTDLVRAIAAKKNINQESGTPLDAAKILRDHPELLRDVSRSRDFMASAQGLADLAPGPFQAVINEVIPQNFGALVGRFIPDDEKLQGVAIATLNKADPPNLAQAESIVRDIRRLGLERAADDAQMDLFGDGFDLRQTVISERARISDGVIKAARADRTIFNRLEKQADTIEEAGNVLNRSENLSRSENAERILQRFLILADQPGPVRDALDVAARALRGGQQLADAVASVTEIFGRPGVDAAGGKSAPDLAGGSAELAPLEAPRLSDLPAVGDAAMEPGLFDDMFDSPAEVARLDTLSREITARLDDPQFDLDLPVSGERNGASISLRAEMATLTEEADFVDALKTLCLTKG